MSTAMLPTLLIPALLSTANSQPMGPWLDGALPIAPDAPIERIGACPEGYLVRGIQLQPAPELYTVWFLDRAWGRAEIIEVITRPPKRWRGCCPKPTPSS